MFSLFRPVSKMKTQESDVRALEYVIQADYENLFKILNDNPTLMLLTVKATDINGETIETSPLKYALRALDYFAWEICYQICKKQEPQLLIDFYDQVHETKDSVDLKSLFDTYERYINLFKDQYKKYKEMELIKKCEVGQLNEEQLIKPLIEPFRDISKAQRQVLPRHMLREMCVLDCNLYMQAIDLTLLSLSPNESYTDNDIVLEISKHDKGCPFLIKGGEDYRFYKRDLLQKWQFFPLSHLPFEKIIFPEQFNQPTQKSCETDIKNWNITSFDYWKWNSIDSVLEDYSIVQDPVFGEAPSQLKKLFPLTTPKAGDEFIYVRGNSALCTAVSIKIPMGHSHFLGFKLQDDLNSFKQLLEKRKRNFDNLLYRLNDIKNDKSEKVKFGWHTKNG